MKANSQRIGVEVKHSAKSNTEYVEKSAAIVFSLNFIQQLSKCKYDDRNMNLICKTRASVTFITDKRDQILFKLHFDVNFFTKDPEETLTPV